MDGTVQTGSLRTHINQDFSEILSEMNWGGMLWLEAQHGKFGIYGNALYASLENQYHDNFGTATVNNDFGIFGVGISYEMYQHVFAQSSHASMNIKPYAGIRYTLNDTTVKVTVQAFRSYVHPKINIGLILSLASNSISFSNKRGQF